MACTKKEAASPGADLEDMQSMLYLIEEADSQYRNGKLNLALKRYTNITKVRTCFNGPAYSLVLLTPSQPDIQ